MGTYISHNLHHKCPRIRVFLYFVSQVKKIFSTAINFFTTLLSIIYGSILSSHAMKLQHHVRYSQFLRVYIFTWRVLLLPRFILNSYFTTLAHHRGPRQRCIILGRHVSILCVHALGRACRLVEHIYNICLTEDDNTVFYNLKRFHQQSRDVYIWQRVELVYTILPFCFLYVQFNLKRQSSLTPHPDESNF